METVGDLFVKDTIINVKVYNLLFWSLVISTSAFADEPLEIQEFLNINILNLVLSWYVRYVKPRKKAY